jgi:2-polyprenyl-3-methyl-5-hydroxy-6-metoxy-1,4-benzoquinol methylase
MYRDYDKHYFKKINNPWNKDAKSAINEIKQVYNISGKVLDLGYGVGRHTKEFTKLNCDVTCIDISQLGFNRLSQYNKNNNLNIKIFNQDMFTFKITGKYDIIFSYMSLQYSKNKKQFSETIEKLKQKTKIGGINYIKIPTKHMTLDFPYKIKGISELKKYYKDWKILFQKEEIKLNQDKTTSSYVLLIVKK